METGKDKGVEEYLMDDDDEDEDVEEDQGKKRATPSTPSARKGSTGGGSSQSCQVIDCTIDMSDAKPYHRRHRVCEHHAKAPVVVIAGLQQRFCQQCSKFHDLSDFDEAKRSCRKRLAQHNERRRKSSYESPGEGSS